MRFVDYPDDVPAVAFRHIDGCGYVRGVDFHMVLAKLVERDKRIGQQVAEQRAFIKCIAGLREESAKLRAVLGELYSWVKNWDAPFLDDDEWPATKTKVEAALAATEEKT